MYFGAPHVGSTPSDGACRSPAPQRRRRRWFSMARHPGQRQVAAPETAAWTRSTAPIPSRSALPASPRSTPCTCTRTSRKQSRENLSSTKTTLGRIYVKTTLLFQPCLELCWPIFSSAPVAENIHLQIAGYDRTFSIKDAVPRVRCSDSFNYSLLSLLPV